MRASMRARLQLERDAAFETLRVAVEEIARVGVQLGPDVSDGFLRGTPGA